MEEADLRVLRLGARVHDLGKIALADEILKQPGALTPEEREAVEQHPITAERILSAVDFLEDVRELVRHEHERWDGGGYPGGLAAEGIPLGSRVILATSAYQAMLAGRPYRRPLSPAQAREELLHGAGSQFDPRVVAALIEVLTEEGGGQDALSESSEERQSRSTLAS